MESREKFWLKVDQSGGPESCWPFTGLVQGGYGRTKYPGIKGNLAHRISYILSNGEIPAGLEVDHDCHNKDLSCPRGKTCAHRRCCNPRHLQLQTRKQNLQNASRVSWERKHFYPRVFCLNGHVQVSENVLVSASGKLVCRACNAARIQNFRQRHGNLLADRALLFSER